MRIIKDLFPQKKSEKINLNNNDLLNYAAELAKFHNWIGLKNKGKSLLPYIKSRGAYINSAYPQINEYYYKTEDVIPAAEWYLDNYYLINELINDLIKDLSKQYESKLWYFSGGDYAGYPRIYVVISEFDKHTENDFNVKALKRFIANYQTEAPLSSAEIWAIPIILKIILLEKIFYQVERILYIQKEREFAEKWLTSVLGEENNEVKLYQPGNLDIKNNYSSIFIERVTRRLKEYGPDAKVLLNWLDNLASKQNKTVEKIINTEQYYLTSHGVLMGCIIAAIKQINSENWSAFFEEVSLVQHVLKNDPAGIFNKMDFESRDKYRHEIENLANKYNVSELTVAKTIQKHAQNAKELPQTHIGYYLLGNGRIEVEKDLAKNWGRVRKQFYNLFCLFKEKPTASYFGMIFGSVFLFFVIFLRLIWGSLGFNIGASAVLLLTILIIVSGMALYGVNRIVCRLLPPSFLPKLELGDDIPEEYKTIVVIPAIFSCAERVRELIEKLEIHYLSNRNKNLYFAILGDFFDAETQNTSKDNEIITTGINGIKKLNKKYGEDRFFYFFRSRVWNDKERVWMGWERKRGKLIEFNRFLLNDGETSYFVKEGNLEVLRDIRYVITVDADTILPRDSARKLIGTIAHPMQVAKLNKEGTKVLSGYGIIQPRIGISVTSAFASRFAKLFTGIAGLDPYTCAISDVYQDLFGEGIFTGKGIYDLRVFHQMTMDTFPENAILSHDLIEGLYTRTGLATDIELFDGFPQKYLSYVKRLHRWIRGDWQIARYIFASNLSAISRWKIVDNLRRSLEAPAQLLLLLLAVTFFRYNFAILVSLFILSLLWPLLLNLIGLIIDKSLTVRILSFELKRGILQSLFVAMVLPYQAYVQLDAVIRSLFRQLVTKKRLLEWETAADAEKRLSTNLATYYKTMLPGIIVSFVFIPGFFYPNLVSRITLSVLYIAWFFSPLVSYFLSIPYKENYTIRSNEEIAELRLYAREIWAFFDKFVSKEDNYLPPDNLQIKPYKGVAHRTSPTNIGLSLLANLAARDLGYITIDSLLTKTHRTLMTLMKMKKWNGHLYNWYNTQTLEPLNPVYVSTVDSGNLAGYMLTLKNGLAEIINKPIINNKLLNGLYDTFRLMLDNSGDLEDKDKNSLMTFVSELNALNKSDLDISALYNFLVKWTDYFYEYSKKIKKQPKENYTENKFSFWLDNLLLMLKSFKQEIETYFPWVNFTNNAYYHDLNNLSNVTAKELIKKYIAITKNKSTPKELSAGIYQALKRIIITLNKSKKIQNILNDMALSMDFKPLFDKQKKLFAIGYNVSEQKLDKSYYDLLASEARQTSLLAIAKGDIPEAHWFKMSRPLTRINGKRSLVSWSGTMFEFLMPLLIFKNYTGTLLDETYKSVVSIQRSYAQKAKIPWGISESGFFSFDIHTNYQYKAFGVPGLGLKRGLSKDMVISPYSSFMALLVDYKNSLENLRLMKRKGFEGLYGLYEAIDFTPERVPYKQQFSLVKSYMSHHQGMSLIALDNVLFNNIMQKRFHTEPIIKTVELLLQEQVPLKEYTFNPIIEEVKEKKITSNFKKHGEEPVIYKSPNTIIPRTHFISNREYSVMLTLSGSGYSKFNNVYITRWREDPTVDQYGSYIYIQNLNSGNVWSATSKPFNDPGEDYKVTCFPNMIKFSRKDGNIITQMEVFVSPEDQVEIRKVSLTNLSQYNRDIEVTSYFEVVLDELSADIAHPTFNKLFIQTGFENNTLFAFRRPRVPNKKELYLMHSVKVEGEQLGDLEYETDRTKFIGRNRSLANPKAMDINQPLSNTVGGVLDPIMSLRVRVRINPGKTVNVYYLTGIGETKVKVLNLAEKYRNPYYVNQAKELSWSYNLMELTNLELAFDEANLLSSLASQIIYPGPIRKNINIRKNTRSQSALWAYGISGDFPIVLARIQDTNHLKMVDQLLKIHEYWKIKGIFVDLVILNEEKTGYFQTIQELIFQKIGISHARKMVNTPGGVFLLKRDQLPDDIITLLFTVARIIFSGEIGSLKKQIRRIVKQAEQFITENEAQTGIGKKIDLTEGDFLLKNGSKNLLFYNGYGGFDKNGKEYVIQLNNESSTPLPWVNIIANPNFGFLVSESGSSYTWSQNSREYKLSPWSNDPLLDPTGEALYIRDEDSGYYWSPVPKPVREKNVYITRHGQGYTVFEHFSNDLKQETTMFVPLNKPLKVIGLKLTNNSDRVKNLSVYYYLEWVLGVSREQTAPYLVTEFQEDTILCQNKYQEEFAGRTAFLTSLGGNLKSFTCSRKDFIGNNHNLSFPKGLLIQKLSGKYGSGYDPCAAIQLEVILQPKEEKKIYYFIGDEKNKEAALSLIKYVKGEKTIECLFEEIVNYWDNILNTIQVETPEKSFDLLFNRWLIYQTIVCRLWARSAFYQSGGAFGFRDQLQDVMPLAVLRPEITRNQILLHCSRQFEEGDVQHWWHPEKGKGIRTRFSDDLLWLPFVTVDYLEHTQDYGLLEEQAYFLTDRPLEEDEDERYSIPQKSDNIATVYEHCVRAIDRSLKFGQHGLPLIGTGDWNDGFSAIGREGKGESVWLGWFLLYILKRFIPICEKLQDYERANIYSKTAEMLLTNIEKNGWDGAWYRRAYYDDGTPLGSISSMECQIDSIAQSWAVISEGAKKSRASDAMLALERYLWDKEQGILKLLTPPFDKTEHNPGYIKGYVPGVRENGGQYTHAAVWAILAYTKIRAKEKALELFNMLNPINHTRTMTEVSKYKVEPYVMAADVYAVFPNTGRGGWTWYTGAAGWMYQVALEGILGFKLEKDKLTVSPCIPSEWSGFKVKYKFKSTNYEIEVKNIQNNKIDIFVDNVRQNDFPIILTDDGTTHKIQIII